MDRFLEINDVVSKLHQNLKKNNKFKSQTRKAKICELLELKGELKSITLDTNLHKEVRKSLAKNYKVVKEKIQNCILLLKGIKLEETILDEGEVEESNEQEEENTEEEVEEEEVEEENTEEEDTEEENTEEEDTEEEEDPIMAHKIDLGVAIRVVDKYDGDAATLQSWLDNVEVLRADDPEVPEANFIGFLKSRLVGAARGALDGIPTIEAAKITLREKFAIQLTPIAVEAELRQLKQRANKTVTEFGSEVEKLATKLAQAWVSKGAPFTTEVSAKPVVEPIAIQTFINGLRDQSAAYLVKSRNPKTLTAAISDALEVQPQSSSEHTFWAQGSSRSPNFAHNYQNNRNQGHRGGRGYNNNSNRGYRGNSHNQRSNNQGYNNNNHDYNSNNRGYYHNNNRYNRRNYNNNPNNNNPNNNYNNNNGNNANRNNNRNNNPNNNNNYQRRNANVAEEPQEQQPREEVNIGEFFRE